MAVVGGGFAGCYLATHLAAGSHVTVYEAGPGGPRAHEWQRKDVTCFRWAPWLTEAPGSTEAGDDVEGGLLLGLKRRLGGRSLCWHGMVPRLQPDEMAGLWPADVVDDLMSPGGYYDTVEAELSQWRGDDIYKPVSDEEAVLRDRLVADLGLPLATPPRAIRNEGGSYVPYSPLPKLLEDGAVEVRAAQRVRAVDQAGDVVLVTDEDGERREYDRAVIAAGAVESARLALSALDRAGTGCALATTFAVHIFTGLVMPFDPGTGTTLVPDEAPVGYWWDEVTGSLGFASVVRGTRGRPDLLHVWLCGPSAANSGAIEIGTGTATATVRVRDLPADKNLRRSHQEVLKRLLPRSLTDQLSFELNFEDAQRVACTSGVATGYWVRSGSGDHEAASLRLGSDLVATSGALRQAPSILLAGPQVFPAIGAANPVLTALALARRTATLLF